MKNSAPHSILKLHLNKISSNISTKRAFTLIELLVVIAIIGVLSVVGVVIFTNVQKSARDATRRADIDAIAKAYETKYASSGTYGDLTPQSNTELFSSGGFPKDPKGGDYTIIQNTSSGGFRICAALENNANPACSTPSDTCFCKSSAQTDPPPLIAASPGSVVILTNSDQAGVVNSCVTDGLIGHWKMDESSGNTVSDNSSSGINGSFSGTGSHWTTGTIEGAGDFNGSNDYVTIGFPNNAKNQGSGVFIPQGDVTFAMWFKTTSSSGGLQVVTGNKFGAGCDRVIWLSGGRLNFNSWSEVNFSGNTAVNDGNWHHLAYVLDRTQGFRAYIDGALYASSTGGTQCGTGCSGFNWADTYQVGTGNFCRGGGNGGYFPGQIDDVRIYNRPLPSTDINLLFNKCKP